MKLGDLLPAADQLKLAEGVEDALVKRRRRGVRGLAVGLTATFALPIIQLLLNQQGIVGWIAKMAETRRWQPPSAAAIAEFVALALAAFGLVAWALLRFTDLLISELREPFRYTFWIEPFELVSETPGKRFKLIADDRFKLLHHDLRERLDRRIRRFSLLNETEKGVDPEGLTSHIHVSGTYTLREDTDDRWVLQVMPRVRIGPPGNAATLAEPVRYVVFDRAVKHDRDGTNREYCQLDTLLTAVDYNQIVERVYSRLATEVYKQIESDVKHKIRLFPTAYLRAVALFHEADDFARSNTVDAYDRALTLYRQALGYFEVSHFPALSRFVAQLPVVWRREVRFQHMEARVRIGYAKCQLYRRYLSALTGRAANPVFEARTSLDQARASLDRLQSHIVKRSTDFMAFITFPPDTLSRRLALRPTEALHNDQRRIRFEAYAVSALTLHEVHAPQAAARCLNDAKSIDPPSSERDALYLAAAGILEPRIDQKILRFRQATEASEQFQIVHYLLAYWSEMQFRAQDEFSPGRVHPVLREYDRVLTINPGNIAALAAQGYLRWLVSSDDADLAMARRSFEEGCEVKATVQDTFIGELTYGLARIEAETGHFTSSLARYTQAIASDPSIAAFSTADSVFASASYYEYVVPSMLRRYQRFTREVHQRSRRAAGQVPPGVLSAVQSYVLNDFGNVCFNYFIRLGDRKRLTMAVRLYDLAVQRNPRNAVAVYNRHEATSRLHHQSDPDVLKEVAEALPSWKVPVIALARSVNGLQGEREDNERAQTNTQARLKEMDDALARLEARHRELKAVDPRQRSDGKKDEDKGRQLALVAEIEGLTLKRAAGQSELGALQSALAQLDDRREDLKIRVKTVFSTNKASPLVNSLWSPGVEALLANRRIRWERLDDYDVEALRAWAMAWPSMGADGSAADRLAVTARLLEHILRTYYPEDFASSTILENVLLKQQALLGDIARGAPLDQAIEERRTIIRTTMELWLGTDPIHFDMLDWHRDYSDAAAQEKATRRALNGEGTDASYAGNLLGASRAHADDLFQRGAHGKAAAAYKSLRAADPTGESTNRGLARICHAEGRQLFEDRQYIEAIAKYSEAVQLDPAHASYRDDRDGAQATSIVAQRCGDKISSWPIVTPIAVEVATNLIPFVEGREGNALNPEMQRRVERMREKVLKTTGVRLPGISFRGNEGDLTPGSYIVMLDEVPLAKAVVPADRLLCLEDPDLLKTKGITGETVDDPLTGRPAVWVEERARESRAIPPEAFLTVPDAIVRHVEALASAQLAEYLGHQEVMNLLETRLPSEYEAFKKDPQALAALTTVMRELVNERVPVRSLRTIVRAFEREWPAARRISPIVERVRAEMLQELPGNDDRHRFYESGPALEAVVEAAIWRGGAEPVLAMEARVAQDVLGAIRPPFTGQRDLVFVTAAALRPHVRALIRHEWPRVPVLSRDEWIPEARTRLIGRIDLPHGGGVVIDSVPVTVALPAPLDRFAAPDSDLRREFTAELQRLLEALFQDLRIPADVALTVSADAAAAGGGVPLARVSIAETVCRSPIGQTPPADITAVDLARDVLWIVHRNRGLLVTPAVSADLQYRWSTDVTMLAYLRPAVFQSIQAMLASRAFRIDRIRDLPAMNGLAARSASAEDCFDLAIRPAGSEPIAIAIQSLDSQVDTVPIDERFALMQDGLFYELGLRVPRIVAEVDPALPPHTFQIRLNDVRLPPERGLEPDQFFVDCPPGRLNLLGIQGTPATHPTKGIPGGIVRNVDGAVDKCHASGFTTWGARDYVVLVLGSHIREDAGSLITLDLVDYDLRSLGTGFPDLVAPARSRFGLARITQIIRGLVSEQISTRNLRGVLESLLAIDGTTRAGLSEQIVFLPPTGHVYTSIREVDALTTADYVDAVRLTFTRYISHRYARGQNTLAAYLLNQEAELRLAASNERPLTGDEHARLVSAVFNKVGAAQSPVVVTGIEARHALRRELVLEFPALAVLSYQEVSPDVRIQPVARIDYAGS